MMRQGLSRFGAITGAGIFRIGTFLVVCAASASMAAYAPPALDSREYKLALDPAKFAGSDLSAKVAALRNVVKPVIGGLDPGSKEKHRRIVFRDTKKCALWAAGFTLRERAKLKNGNVAEDAELTLKFRVPDVFIAADVNLSGSNDTKLEEDIVTFRGADGGPSMRSLYSRSVNQDVDDGEMPESVRDATKRFPGLKKELRKNGVAESVLEAALVEGPPIREMVFEGGSVDLDENADAKFAPAKFAITLWYSFAAPPAAAPLAAELSYKYKADNGDVSGKVARRALSVFRGLQDTLKDWASSEHEPKTALGLPACE
jgi:hypothetical protein